MPLCWTVRSRRKMEIGYILYYWKYVLWTSRVNVTWESIKNAESQSPLQEQGNGLCVETKWLIYILWWFENLWSRGLVKVIWMWWEMLWWKELLLIQDIFCILFNKVNWWSTFFLTPFLTYSWMTGRNQYDLCCQAWDPPSKL